MMHCLADSILQQSGIFDALRRNWLRAIQLVISGRPGKPLHALESYTFTFCYENIGPDKSLTGWNLQGPSGEPITMKTAQFALQNFMRKLIAMCHTLPELPGRDISLAPIQFTNSPHVFRSEILGHFPPLY